MGVNWSKDIDQTLAAAKEQFRRSLVLQGELAVYSGQANQHDCVVVFRIPASRQIVL